MSLFKKIFTAIRGGAREAGEAIVDKNSIRIFEQEIKDAENQLEKAKQGLAEVLANKMQAGRKIASLKEEIKKHEQYAQQAMKKDKEDLALEVAQKIVELQSELEIHEKSENSFSAHASRMKDMIKKTHKSLADMKRQLVMVKTTENVQKATTSITQNYASGSSKLLTAKESLDRIKKKQQNLEDRLAAGGELQDDFGGKSLDDKMKDAGIIEGEDKAQQILAKLKSKK
ncbi:PspA/IM30 family protein [Flavobacteriaceae bacterium]|nr:PspA/IM30 family protein [Flavobacteriaceae bacterium]